MSDDKTPQHARGGVMYTPTEEQHRMVKVMSGFGIPQPDIAAQIGIDAKTLRKHFREELDRGMTEANMRVAQSLFNMATTGSNVAAAIFWMKARAGWREKHEVVVSTEDKAANMTDEEYRERLARLKAGIAALEGPPTITMGASDDSPAPRLSLTQSAAVHHWPCSPPTNDR